MSIQGVLRTAALPVAAAAALLTGGCAASPPAAVAAPEPPALESYARNPFVPVNLYVNANEHVEPQRAKLLEYAAARLEESGAFLRVDRGTQRWLYSLQLRFRETNPGARGDTARRVLGYVTLGLLPVRVHRVHHLTAEVFLEPEPVGKLTYTESIRDSKSLYDLADPNQDERAAIDRLLQRMMADVASKKVLPRAKDFAEPPAEQKKKKKGQAT